MKKFNINAKAEETREEAVESTEIRNVIEENTSLTNMGASTIDDLEKVTETSNEIKQQSIPKAFFSGNKNIKALAENDVVISKVLKNVLDWLLLVTSASTIRRAEYEDLTEQMLKYEDDATTKLEMQVKFKRAFEQIQRKQQEQSKLLEKLSRMKIWVAITTGMSLIAIALSIMALMM